MLFFTASDFTSIISHIHSWVLILLWLHPFILSGVISPLFSSSILDTYQPGEFIFQCPIFFPFLLFMGSVRDWPRLAHECPGVSSGGLGLWWPAVGSGHWMWQWVHGTFWRGSPLSSLPPPYFGPRSNNRGGTQSHPSTGNWSKGLLRTGPSFPLGQSLPSGSFHKLLILHH